MLPQLRKAGVALCAVMIMLAPAACAPIALPSTPDAGPAEPTVAAEASPTMASVETASQTASVRVGGEFAVALDGNPSTGYNWYVKDIDTSIVEQVGESTFSQLLKMPGAGGVVTTTFRGVAPGRTNVTMVYERSFEANSTIRTHIIEVTVR